MDVALNKQGIVTTLGSGKHKKWPTYQMMKTGNDDALSTKCQQCPWANDSGFFSISLFITKGQLPLRIMRLKRKRNLQGVLHKLRDNFFLRIQDTQLTMRQMLMCAGL